MSERLKNRPIRVVIDMVLPQIDAGAFPIKRSLGDQVEVQAHAFADGHDVLCTALLHRRRDQVDWHTTPMKAQGNDIWSAAFALEALTPYVYCVEAWIDEVATWHHGLKKKVAAAQDVTVELKIGADLLAKAAARTTSRSDAALLTTAVTALAKGGAPAITAAVLLAAGKPDPSRVVRYERELAVDVERERARFSAWYELFPRSASPDPARHGTLRDCAARLDYVKALGFDVVYLPPIHPIGTTARKGKDNAATAEPGDVGSPWAIGAKEGGHDAIHPLLGTLADFKALVDRARALDLEIALDLAFQCSPDHPYVKAHPSWFKHRPDGSIQYAENPPKKYQDIFPLDLDGDDWETLWNELLRVVLFWVEQGVKIFRVDNPHTKPFSFWQWLISQVRQRHPDVFFLAEAFTRPKVMYRLAKLGFSQSYNYFPWRNTKAELTQYLTEVTHPPVSDFFRANLWPNTPDILPERLQAGGRAIFLQRLVLAATLGASYGIYGPSFELCDDTPRTPGTEEYARSEKYELRSWDLADERSIRHTITRVNQIRRENPALQRDDTLRFIDTDNDQLLAYLKSDGDDTILMVVNLDPEHTQSGFVHVPLASLALDPNKAYQVHDLLGGGQYLWNGERSFVELDPQMTPAHIFRLRRKLRSEQDFDYFL